jgi:hypothetical protein
VARSRRQAIADQSSAHFAQSSQHWPLGSHFQEAGVGLG